MTSGMSTASGVIKGVGGMASMIPGYGTAIGAGLSAVGGILDMVDADQQKSEAAKLAEEAKRVQKKPLEKEYLQALRGLKMQSLAGMPGYEQAQEGIDIGAANALKSIKEASPYGGTVVDAINATLNKGSQEKTQLAGKQAEFKYDAKNKLLSYLSGVGDKQRDLTKEKQDMQAALYSEAGDLRAAGTANKAIGRDKILGGLIQGVGGIAKGIGGAQGGMGSTGVTETTVDMQPTDTSIVRTDGGMLEAGTTAPQIETLDARGVGALDVNTLDTDTVAQLTDKLQQAAINKDYDMVRAIRAKIAEAQNK